MSIIPLQNKGDEEKFQAAAEDLLAQYGGNAVEVVKALMVYNCYLEDRINEISASVRSRKN